MRPSATRLRAGPPRPGVGTDHGAARGAWRVRAIVGALALALGTGSFMTLAGCASAPGSPPRRNGMEAPPPFPVAPDFSVPDALGAPQTLSSLMGPRGLVLVLYRGHW